MRILLRKWNTFLRILEEEGLKAVFYMIYIKLLGKLNINLSYAIWRRKNELNQINLQKLSFKPFLSVILPVYNVKNKYLEECIRSVLCQTYDHWELCIVDDASTITGVKKILKKYQNNNKIHIKYRKENGNISKATNDAITMAKGEFIVFLDCDDTLAKNALYEVALKINDFPLCDVIYSDEDKITSIGRRYLPFFKPDWSPDTIMSFMYTCHLSVYRKDILEQIGGLRSEFDGAQDYDLILRTMEITDKIIHIPKILYHWRTHNHSTAKTLEAKPYIQQAAKRAKEEALKRRGIKAFLEFKKDSYQWNVVYQINPKVLVSIILLSKDHPNLLQVCIQSLIRTINMPYEIIVWDNGSSLENRKKYERICNNIGCKYYYEKEDFNFSSQCNKAAKKTKGSILLFLNDDIEAIKTGWMERMAGHVLLSHVGAVGAKLYYPKSKLIQHCGVISLCSGPSHVLFGKEDNQNYYFGRNCCVYNYSAVTGACFMIRKEVFEQVGGFDVEFPIDYNDVDLCYRLSESGYYNVVRNDVVLYHSESVSRGKVQYDIQKKAQQKKALSLLKYKHQKRKNDPFYNINLTQHRVDLKIK